MSPRDRPTEYDKPFQARRRRAAFAPLAVGTAFLREHVGHLVGIRAASALRCAMAGSDEEPARQNRQ